MNMENRYFTSANGLIEIESDDYAMECVVTDEQWQNFADSLGVAYAEFTNSRTADEYYDMEWDNIHNKIFKEHFWVEILLQR